MCLLKKIHAFLSPYNRTLVIISWVVFGVSYFLFSKGYNINTVKFLFFLSLALFLVSIKTDSFDFKTKNEN